MQGRRQVGNQFWVATAIVQNGRGLHSLYDSELPTNLGNEACRATQWPWGMDLLRVAFQFNVIDTAVIDEYTEGTSLEH